MSRLGILRRGFSLALSQELIYRLNFLLGRVREFIVFASLLYLYTSLPDGLGAYSQTDLLAYTLGSALLAAPLFQYGMHAMAEEIANGELANYLLRPINYFGYWSARLLAIRALMLVGGVVQVALLLFIFKRPEVLSDIRLLSVLQASVLFIGSLLIIQGLDFLAAFFSFWTPRGHGPRWLVTIAVAFLSGSFMPIDVMPTPIRSVLMATPFPSLIFAPVKTLIGEQGWSEVVGLVLKQGLWIIVIYTLVIIVWRKGLKRYAAYGN